MKNKIVYKLTDKFGRTKDNTQWGENVSHAAKGDGKRLCSDGWIHYYTHPLIAVLMNPIHADFTNPKLWEAEASGKIINEALKSGCKTLTTIKEIPLPEVSGVQKIAFGILCAKEVYDDKAWNKWADKWLSGDDRSKETANAARNDATYYAVDYAATRAAYASANAAARAANANKSINFIALAEKAMTYK